MASYQRAPRRSILDQYNRISWSIIAWCGFALLIFGILTTGVWAQRTANQNAERMEVVIVKH